MNAHDTSLPHTDALVIGGGWAGLWSACALARSGARVRLLERRSAMGGRAETGGPSGFHLNLGPHALYRSGEAREALAELGVRPSGRTPPTGGARAFLGALDLPLPVGWLSFLTTPLLEGRARWALMRALADAMRGPLGPYVGMTTAAWLDGLGLDARARAVLSTMLRLTTYADDEAHLDAAAAQAQLRRGLRGNVLYLDGGWAQVTEALRARAGELGVDLRTSAAATGLVRGPRGWTVTTEGASMTASVVIVATPPEAAARLVPALAPRLSAVRPVRAAVLDVALRALPAPERCLALGIDRPLYASVHSASAALAPPGGAVVHVARYGGAGPAGEAELEDALDRLQPGWRAQVVERRYLPRITVTHDLPEAGRPRVGADESGAPGVFLAGDWVGARGMLADAALASARDAVAHARAALAAAGGGARARSAEGARSTSAPTVAVGAGS